MKFTLYKHYHSIQIKTVLFVLSTLLLCSCLSIKPTTTKSGKQYFETFYVGEEGTQYFIKPILLTSDTPKENLHIDYTFRYKNEIKDSSIINFSIKSLKNYTSIDSLKITTTNITFKSHKVLLLFNEKSNDMFTSRFTTKVSLQTTKKLFSSNKWIIYIYNNNKETRYTPNKRSNKIINTLKDEIFNIIH